jgi:hypothetical protein
MTDSRQFSIARVRLDALRKQIPPSIDESRVADYHSIVDALEASSGEVLKDFRIPDHEIKPKVVSAVRGSYRGGPGRVTHSDKKYCDHGYFTRQVEALWQHVQTLRTTATPPTSEHKDYWSMDDAELERLAATYHIPSVGRTGEHSEHWYVDRPTIIAALVKRDKSLQGQRPLSHTSNTLNVQNMVGSAIQQGTQDSTVTVNYKSKETEIRDLLARIASAVDELEISPQDKGALRVDIGTVSIQLSADTPKSSIISECLHSVRAILEHAAGHALAIAFLAQMNALGI